MNFEHNPALRASARQTFEEEAWLLGQPSLRGYLDYLEESSGAGPSFDRRAAVDEWRAANDYYYDLEQSEAGFAEQKVTADIDPSLDDIATTIKADARFRRAFNCLPTRIAMLELDRLIVSQRHVNVDHAIRLEAELGANPSPEAVFRRCLALDGATAPVEVRKTGSSRYQFWSSSSDMRFQEPVLLGAEQIVGYEGFGPLGACVGLMVGFSSNFLSVIQSDDRYVIHNGHHRAYALRRMGFTHAPCIVQRVSRLDELALVASSKVIARPEVYFRAARPPVLKDFFDPKICKVLSVPKLLNLIEVSFEVKDFEVKDFAPNGVSSTDFIPRDRG